MKRKIESSPSHAWISHKGLPATFLWKIMLTCQSLWSQSDLSRCKLCFIWGTPQRGAGLLYLLTAVKHGGRGGRAPFDPSLQLLQFRKRTNICINLTEDNERQTWYYNQTEFGHHIRGVSVKTLFVHPEMGEQTILYKNRQKSMKNVAFQDKQTRGCSWSFILEQSGTHTAKSCYAILHFDPRVHWSMMVLFVTSVTVWW